MLPDRSLAILVACLALALSACGEEGGASAPDVAVDTDPGPGATDRGPADDVPTVDPGQTGPGADTGTRRDAGLGDADPGRPDLSPARPSCEEYCELQAVCGGEHRIYESEATCLEVCLDQAGWPAGSYAGDQADTIGCRLAQLKLAEAREDPESYCPAAGPTGGGVCGSLCESYCRLAERNCKGTNTLYSGAVDCNMACAGLPEAGTAESLEGNTVECRIAQLLLAGQGGDGSAASTHCPIASAEGAEPCVGHEGEGCEHPIVVESLPFLREGSTVDGPNNFRVPEAGCPTLHGGAGAGSPDALYVFTPEQDGVHNIVLDSVYDALVYVSTDCEQLEGSCVASSDRDGEERIRLEVTAGTDYFIIVDGAKTTTKSGSFTLAVSEPCLPACEAKDCGPDGCGGSCGSCGESSVCGPGGQCIPGSEIEGNTCEKALEVGTLPFNAEGDTTVATNDFAFSEAVCPGEQTYMGQGSNDHVYRFEPAAEGVYEVTLEADFEAVLYAFTDCSDVDGTCLAADDSFTGMSISVHLTPPAAYYFAVDGWTHDYNEAGAYRISFAEPCLRQCQDKDCGPDGCGGSCGACSEDQVCGAAGTCLSAREVEGNTCARAFEIGALPFEASGDTLGGATDSYHTDQGACAGLERAFGLGSGDQVYRFAPGTGGDYEIRVEASFNVGLYVVTDCADVAGTCVVARDHAHATETLEQTLEAGKTYFVIVDGTGNTGGAEGTYTLTVTETE